ncbi:MAG TPA: GNAT family N-acetyltransferase [Chthoniobacterales bacterium]|nr:GNAT family N-acetyltransferase [Chthoniobacterales bacterium]
MQSLQIEKGKEWYLYEGKEEEISWLWHQFETFEKKKLASTKEQPTIYKNYFIKNEHDSIIAGIKSWAFFSKILYIEGLFVKENYRHQRLGSILLDRVENECKAIGVQLALTYADFKAKDFYVQHNYEIFSILENCPAPHACYFLKKNLNSTEQSHAY